MGNHRADHRGPKRAAVEPRRTREAAREPVREPAPRTTSRAGSAGGKRKASRRRATPAFLPSAPTIVGAVAILAAAGGAVAFGPGQLPGSDGNLALSSGSAEALNGSDALPAGSDARALAISRDSQRQALQDTSKASTQQAVEEQADQRTGKLLELADSAEKRADQIAKNLWVLPTVGYHLTARFGQVGLWSSVHTGLDFAAPSGTPIYAIATGVITDTGYDGSYGNKTVETLPDGTEIWYCHQTTIGVSIGDKVIQSAQIGTVGSTGHTTGPHVHIEVRPGGGDPVDPYPEFVYHGVTP
ncbi:murein DD-endopeptidase MepM/ murein hydrolase activator NlpD [Marmoricola sp. URHA0025 HA25]